MSEAAVGAQGGSLRPLGAARSVRAAHGRLHRRDRRSAHRHRGDRCCPQELAKPDSRVDLQTDRRVDDHHVAEFRALIAGLRMAKRQGVDKIRAFTDTELVVRSIYDEIKLGSEAHQRLRMQARRIYRTFGDRRLSWVPREMNTEADLLASRALPLRPSKGQEWIR